ncbi:MAG: hypothetical protein HQL47_05595 [Gammaproteobacteria bacterium]|nr:hypothetical protein [Gammaproteobacteria bacterium]
MIQLAVQGEIEQMLARVEQALRKHGGQFQGDGHAGQFAGKTLLGEVQGKYAVSGAKVSIEIVRKPSMVPMAMIEKEIRKFFSEG